MSRWSTEEVNILKREYSKGSSPEEISRKIKRSTGAIKNKAYKLKITNNPNFTDEELKFIKENYKTMNLRELSKVLGREQNYTNVCRKAKELELTDKSKLKISKDGTPVKGRYKLKRSKIRKYATKEERNAASSERMIAWHKKNPHPRGMLGKTHSEPFKKEMSKRLKKAWKDPNHKFNSEEFRDNLSERMSSQMVKRIKKGGNIYSSAKGGTRTDLGFYVRSRWEANVARYLKYLQEKGSIYKWEYEPDTFWFEGIKRGTRSYTPDFKIWEKSDSKPYYWEVKGYMDPKSKTRLKRMEKYHPEVKIHLIMQKEYSSITKYSALIKNWEQSR